MINSSSIFSNLGISIGIGLFGCGILIQQFILHKNNETNKKNNYEILFEKTHDVSNYLDSIADYYFPPDESREFYKSNVNQSNNIKLHLEQEDDQNNDYQINTEQSQEIINNDKDKYKINQLVNRMMTKTKSEIEFEFNNQNQVIIKIICRDDDEICRKFERKIIDLISSIYNKDLNIIIETESVTIRCAVSICNSLYIYKKINPLNKIKIYVPKYVYNTGTYIVLMADQLYLNDYTLLSPTDIQLNLAIEKFSVNDYIKYSDDDDRKTTDIFKNSLMMSIVATKYLSLSTFIFNKFIFNNCNRYNPKIRKQITNKFINTEYPYVITLDKDEITNAGIEVAGNVPKEIMDIYNEVIKK